MSESVTTQGGRHTLRMERRLRHPVHKVWRAISEPKELSAWWPMKIDELPLRVGAEVHFYDEGGGVSIGVISELQVGRVLAFRETAEDGEHEVVIELEPDGQGCRFVFTHSFNVGTPPAQHARGWNLCFVALEARVDGRPVPSPPADVSVRAENDRWTLVFVRELRHPPERVWSALTDPEELRAWAPFDAEDDLGVPRETTLTMAGGPTEEKLPCSVRRAEPPRLLEYTWGEDLLRWELERTTSGTRLTLRHTIGDRDWVSKVAAGWHICLDVADRKMAGQPVSRIVGDAARQHGWQALDDVYSARLQAAH